MGKEKIKGLPYILEKFRLMKCEGIRPLSTALHEDVSYGNKEEREKSRKEMTKEMTDILFDNF